MRWLLLAAGLVLLCGLVVLLGQVMRDAEGLRELQIRQLALEQRVQWIPAVPGVQRGEYGQVSVQRGER